jgi:hypothetical protein
MTPFRTALPRTLLLLFLFPQHSLVLKAALHPLRDFDSVSLRPPFIRIKLIHYRVEIAATAWDASELPAWFLPDKEQAPFFG